MTAVPLRPTAPPRPARQQHHRTRTALHVAARDKTPLAVTYWAGPTTTNTVVFLHGLCLAQTAWCTQINAVLRHFGPNTSVISYDHRGHGQSGAAPIRTYRIDQLADDLDQILTTLRIHGPVTLVGHSLGAMVALTYLANSTRRCSAPITGLVLCATAAGKLTTCGIGRLLTLPALGAILRVVEHTPDRATGALVAPLSLALSRLRTHGSVEHQTLANVIANALTTTALSTAVGFLPSLRDYDQLHTLTAITACTTIISGGTDLLTPPEHSTHMAANIAGAAHVHIPHAGHMLPQQAARRVNTAITDTITAATERSPHRNPPRSLHNDTRVLELANG